MVSDLKFEHGPPGHTSRGGLTLGTSALPGTHHTWDLWKMENALAKLRKPCVNSTERCQKHEKRKTSMTTLDSSGFSIVVF